MLQHQSWSTIFNTAITGYEHTDAQITYLLENGYFMIRIKNTSRQNLLITSPQANNAIKILAALLLLCLTPIVNAASKIALIIGNSKYQYAEHLPIPANDAKAVSNQLRTLGFETVEGIDVSKGEMKALLRRFSDKLELNSVALFYYAGHGIQRDGKNFLIPVNADIKKAYELEDAGMDLNIVLEAFNEVKPKLAIALIDACRDNPFEKRYKATTRGLRQQGAGLADVRDHAGGTILSYATEPGKTAIDGYGEHSPYTAALLKYMKVPGLSVHDMLNEVGLEVLRTTNEDQQPWVASSPVARFCFAGCNASTTPTLAIKKSKATGKHMALKVALQSSNFKDLKKLVFMSKKQKAFLQRLFTTYASLAVDVSSATKTRSTKGGKRNPEVIVTITEAINKRGNRVIPSTQWNSISFSYR